MKRRKFLTALGLGGAAAAAAAHVSIAVQEQRDAQRSPRVKTRKRNSGKAFGRLPTLGSGL